MQLYSGPLSLFTAKVRIALREKGIAAEIIDVPFGRQGYEPKHPEVVRRNPKAQVPVLVDGEVSLTDSTVILEYLEDRYPEPALYPKDPAGRARCRQLEMFADEILFPPVLTLIRQVFYTPEGGGDAEAVAEARRAIAGFHDDLEAQLGDGPFFCGAFSVADVGIFLDCMFAASFGAGFGERHVRLRAWLERMSARPAIAQEAREMLAFQASLPPKEDAAA
ncbi:MAG: glutathione S-transferase family protein [Myxococcales bacterium]|nr:glutathione S-transferase family protein [Myxococcales bacterium]